jgi:hypothetical protein
MLILVMGTIKEMGKAHDYTLNLFLTQIERSQSFTTTYCAYSIEMPCL